MTEAVTCKPGAFNNPFKPALVLDADDVAAILTVRVDTVKTLHRVGRLPGVKVGRHLRWRLDDVQRFVDGLAAGE